MRKGVKASVLREVLRELGLERVKCRGTHEEWRDKRGLRVRPRCGKGRTSRWMQYCQIYCTAQELVNIGLIEKPADLFRRIRRKGWRQ